MLKSTERAEIVATDYKIYKRLNPVWQRTRTGPISYL